jgi:hypothetical protein
MQARDDFRLYDNVESQSIEEPPEEKCAAGVSDYRI